MINVEVGARIRELRESHVPKWSQADLAAACGWDDGQMRISNYERGTRQISLKDLQTIANALETTLVYLVGGDAHYKTPLPLYVIPVISWADVVNSRTWTEATLEKFKKEKEIVAMFQKGYEGCCALTVNDDLMNSPNVGEPSFKQGEAIIFMPNAVPKSGDAVIAYKKNSPQAMLKCYVSDGVSEYLYSTKPGHANRIDIDDNIIILGVVMGSADIKMIIKPEEREIKKDNPV